MKRFGNYLLEYLLIRPFKFWKIRGYEVEIKYEPLYTPAMSFEPPQNTVKKFKLYSDAVDYFNVEIEKPLYDSIELFYIDNKGNQVKVKSLWW